MRRVLNAIRKDLWVILLDLVAVNLSYYLALLIRFYVGGLLRPVAVDRYLPAWIAFAPYYSVVSIIIFAIWRLYGGIWRYAGINDMNRIILANVCTTVVHVLVTVLFVERMPITYYLIGALLQFLFIVIIRFSYRILLVEKRKLQRGKKIKAIVVGSGENGRRVVKNLEESELCEPISVYSSSVPSTLGRKVMMDGIPITQTLSLDGIQAVFIADPLMVVNEREEIRSACEINEVEFHDYTGYFSNLGGRISLTELMSVVKGPIVVEFDGKERNFENGEAALKELREKYEVKEIEGMKIKLKKSQGLDKGEALKAAYAAVIGDEPGGWQ